jgi:hypothetical protein
MFTTTNVNPSVVPPAAIVHPSFQIMNTPNNHHTLVSSSSPNPSWRLNTPAPSVVSIINGNSSTFYIATQPSSTTSNIIRQSPQTVRLVSPSFTLINNSNTTLTGQSSVISSSNNNCQSSVCVDTSILGRLATSTIQHFEEEKVEKKKNSFREFFSKRIKK